MSVARETGPVEPSGPENWPAWTDDWRWVPTEEDDDAPFDWAAEAEIDAARRQVEGEAWGDLTAK
jgi:hypothetical protein